ncbi:FAD-dependent monooxygenase [Hydrotalea sp.]|uniref:NAD(P)/FAD-dependent oxidoreductase n=1 Tax=Hydrotalea sp. TaxID=2881279 RepID=UPI00261FEA90|nr:FAD-dependent monooxygenase [Hydrotalea sp.]
MLTAIDFDVAIIGGGLGGLTLAIQCANAGYSVALFEKEQYPFHKVCGEYVSNESKPFLTQLGIPLEEWNLPVIQQLLITDVKGKAYPFALDLGGFGISRYLLDNALYELAVQKNAQVFCQTKVLNVTYLNNYFEVAAINTNVSAKVVVGSFGKRSNFDVQWKRIHPLNAKSTSVKNFVGVKYHIRYPFPSNQIALHNFKNGYCGISMIEDRKCCLCYLTTADNLRNNENRIDVMQEKVLFKNPALKKIFTEADFLYTSPQVIAQVSFAPKTQIQNHVLMIGDAAGLITPLCGNGMSMAMHAGKLVFGAIDSFLKGTINRMEMEQQYAANWKHHFQYRLWIGRKVQTLMGDEWLTSLSLNVLYRLSFLAKQVIASTHGQPF